MMSGCRRRLHLLLVAVVAVGLTTFGIFPELFRFAAVAHYGHWFIDTFAILASNDAVALGLDPYAPNPLDYFERPHVYSHWWLHLRDLGLTRADNLWVGLIVVAAFLITALARLRPRTWGEWGWYLAIFFSTPVVLGINRANNDLLIFTLLAPVVPLLLHGSRALSWIAIGLIAIATGLKYYPAVTGLVLLAGVGVTANEIRARLGLALLALLVVGLSVGKDLAQLTTLVPQPRGLLTFGAGNLFRALGLSGPWSMAVSAMVAAGSCVVFWRARWFRGWIINPADLGAWLSFILGAILLIGCFFSGTNYAYRWIFSLWMAPLLWRLPRDVDAPAGVRRLARVTASLLIVALWADTLATRTLRLFDARLELETAKALADAFFDLEQPFTWAFFICLLGFITHFVRENLTRVFKGDSTASSVP